MYICLILLNLHITEVNDFRKDCSEVGQCRVGVDGDDEVLGLGPDADDIGLILKLVTFEENSDDFSHS